MTAESTAVMFIIAKVQETHFKFIGDLQFGSGNPQSKVDSHHGDDSDEDCKVTDDCPHL